MTLKSEGPGWTRRFGSEANSAWFPCNEGAGLLLNDKLGNVSPLSLSGYSSNIWTKKPGWFTPNGTNTYFLLPSTLAPTFAVGSSWLFGMSVYRFADSTTSEFFYTMGDNTTVKGHFGIQILSGGQLTMITRGINGSANAFPSFLASNYDTTTFNGRNDGSSILIAIHEMSPISTILADLYVNGVYKETITLDFTLNSGTAVPVTGNDKLFASANASPNTYVGNATAQTSVRNILISQRGTYDANRVASIARTHASYPLDLPRLMAN